MLLAWLVFFLIAFCACIDFKKTVIIWMTCRLLFNAQVALRYEPPAMSLDFGVAILLIFLFIVRERDKGISKDKFYLKPILVLTIISYALSFLFSITYIDEGIRLFAKIIIMNFAILFVFQKVLYSMQDLRLFVKSLLIVAILITGLGVYESIYMDNPVLDYVYYHSPREGTEGRMYYIPPGEGNELQLRYEMVRAYSFFGIHIAYGRACVLILGFLLIMRKYRWHNVNKWLMTAVILMVIAGCVTSNSKTVYVGMITTLLLLINPRDLLSYKTVVVVISSIIVVAIVYQYFPNYFNNLYALFDEELAEEGGGSSIALRQRQLEVAMEMFHQNPILGNGPGALVVLRTIGQWDDILGAEGALLTILPERGIVGYLVYLFTFIYFFISSIKIIPPYAIFVFLLAIFVMEVVSGIGDMTLAWALIIATRRAYQLDKKNKYFLPSQHKTFI